MSDDEELPEGWRESNLGAVINGFESARNLQAIGRPSEPSEFGVLKISAVTWGEFNPKENKALLPGDKPKPHEIVHRGDLLITRANTTALVGAVVRVATDYPQLMLPDKILRICYRADAVDPNFLMHSLRTTAVREYFEENATGTSDSMRNLSQPKLEATPLALPPLPEQRRIVAKLESLQARSRRAREALDAVPPLLEKLRQSILAAAFRGDLTKDWREKHPDVEPASELLKRIRVKRRKKWEESELAKMKTKGKAPTDDKWKAKYVEPEPVDESELPELPEGWCWASVEELATKVVDGVHKKPDYVASGIPFLTVRNLTAGQGISFEETSFVTQQDHDDFTKRADPEFGDLLITKDGTLGVTRFIRSREVFSIFVSLALVKPSNRQMGEYLELAFQSPYFQERFVATVSGLQHIHLVDLRAAALPIAPLREQDEIVRRAEQACTRIDNLAAGHDELASQVSNLDAAILSKAFRGELVPQEPGDAIDAEGDVATENDGSAPGKTSKAKEPSNGRAQAVSAGKRGRRG
jgi:type I restriction enzyme S subunit